MNKVTLRSMLERRPFQPFEIRMSSGDVYQVRYPSCAALGRAVLVILDPDSEEMVICALEQMDSINAPQSA
jgi:hypothetical protein